MTDEQIQLLDDIGFDWNPTGGAHDVTWHSKYQQLADFYREHGHLKVGGVLPNMTQWKAAQRKKFKAMQLTEEQIQMLNDIGFQWTDRQATWNARYEELAAFYKQHGHLKVEPGILFQWKITQRRKRRGMKGYMPLTEEQIQLLDEIGFS